MFLWVCLLLIYLVGFAQNYTDKFERIYYDLYVHDVSLSLSIAIIVSNICPEPYRYILNAFDNIYICMMFLRLSVAIIVSYI